MSQESEIERRAKNHINRYKEIRSRNWASQRHSSQYVPSENVLDDPLEVSAERYGDGYSPLELILIKKGFSRSLSQES